MKDQNGLPNMHEVYSSNVSAVGYDEETLELYVQWKRGKVSRYLNVPQNVAKSVMQAYSVGQAIADTIKPAYAHQYV